MSTATSALKAAKARLLPRLGQFVPCVRRPALGPDWTTSCAGFRAQILPPDDADRVREVKDYMRREFYTKAPIPVALGLARYGPGTATHAQVEREMDMYMNSGFSMELVRESDGRLIGSGLSTFFPRDDGYEVLGIPQRVWHNAAAEIAHEVRPEDPVSVWRDYQFQHFYDVTQRCLQTHPDGLQSAFYLGCFIVDDEAKASGFTQQIFRSWQEHGPIGDICVTQSNFSGFDKFVYAMMRDVQLLDEMAYADEELTVGGEKVFQVVKDLGHMRFFSGRI